MDGQRINMDNFQSLLEKFYRGTITPQEQSDLLGIACTLGAEGSYEAEIDRKGLREDIALLTGLHLLSETYAGESTVPYPDDLEKRLDRHIHSLALTSRRPLLKRGFRKYLAIGAASVAMIAVATGIWRILDHTTEPASDPIASILIAKPDGNPTPMHGTEEKINEAHPHTQTKEKHKKSLSFEVDPPQDHPDIEDRTEDVMEEESSLPISPAEIDMETEAPGSRPPVTVVEPSNQNQLIATATGIIMPESLRLNTSELIPANIFSEIDTSLIVTMPISSFATSFDKVYDSMEILSAALSGTLQVPETDPDTSKINIPTQPI